jgi:hypothetical protein
MSYKKKGIYANISNKNKGICLIDKDRQYLYYF